MPTGALAHRCRLKAIDSSSLRSIYRRELFGGMSIQAEAWVKDCVLFGPTAIQPDRRPYRKAHAPYLHPIRIGSVLVVIPLVWAGESYIHRSYG